MLIVAMPRSASTSLSHTLAGITEMRRSKPTHRGLDPSYNPHLRQLATGYEKMPHAGAIRFESTQLVDWITARDRLYREHILPVREHRDIFRTISPEFRKVVVLQRSPEEAFLSEQHYWERDLPRQGNNYNFFENAKTIREQYKRFAENLPRMFPESDGLLHVQYDDLIHDHDKWIKKILDYWDFKYPDDGKYTLATQNVSVNLIQSEYFSKTYRDTAGHPYTVWSPREEK